MEQSWTSPSQPCLAPLAPWPQPRSLPHSHPGASPAAPSGLWPGLGGLGLGLLSTRLPWRTEEGFGVRVPNQPPLLPVLPANERMRPSAGCRSEVAPTVPFFVVWDTAEQFGAPLLCAGGRGTFSLDLRGMPPGAGDQLVGGAEGGRALSRGASSAPSSGPEPGSSCSLPGVAEPEGAHLA